MPTDRFEIFGGDRLETLYIERRNLALQEIQRAGPDSLLTKDITEYADDIFGEYQLSPPELRLDPDDIRICRAPERPDLLLVNVPFDGGDPDTLRYKPAVSSSLTPSTFVHEKNVVLVWGLPSNSFETETKRQTAISELQSRIRYDLGTIEEIYRHFLDECEGYNKRLEQEIIFASEIEKKIRTFQETVIESLEFESQSPKERYDKLPTEETYGHSPSLTESLETAEGLSDGGDGLLWTINYAGEHIENHQKYYVNNDEEELRSHIRLALQIAFDDSVTAETHNREGKTDLLVCDGRDRKFIAECGIYDGRESVEKKLEQLLGYLTRNSGQSALILFIDRKNLNKAEERTEKALRDHESCIDLIESDKPWTQFTFDCYGKGHTVELSLFTIYLPGLTDSSED